MTHPAAKVAARQDGTSRWCVAYGALAAQARILLDAADPRDAARERALLRELLDDLADVLRVR